MREMRRDRKTGGKNTVRVQVSRPRYLYWVESGVAPYCSLYRSQLLPFKPVVMNRVSRDVEKTTSTRMEKSIGLEGEHNQVAVL